jgi:hypothetical protein
MRLKKDGKKFSESISLLGCFVVVETKKYSVRHLGVIDQASMLLNFFPRVTDVKAK